MGFLIDGKPLEYTSLIGQESFGKGYFGIKIDIAGNDMPDLRSDEAQALRIVARKAAESIQEEWNRMKNKNNPEIEQQTKRNRQQIVDEVFEGRDIFVEEIPNGYCKSQCCEHLPWFRVTTQIGVFVIGWRKRVISIDWGATVCTATAQDLFADEDVTKMGKSMHAWSIEDAKKYVKRVIADVGRV